MSFPVKTTSGEIVQIKDIETVDPTRPMEGKVYIAEDGKRYRPPAGTNQYLVVEEIPTDELEGPPAVEPASSEATDEPHNTEEPPAEAPTTPEGVDEEEPDGDATA